MARVSAQARLHMQHVKLGRNVGALVANNYVRMSHVC